MASGEGVCADAVEIENTSMDAMINRRLAMDSSDERSRGRLKIEFPNQQALALKCTTQARAEKVPVGIAFVQTRAV
jgi:hypothetical protein